MGCGKSVRHEEDPPCSLSGIHAIMRLLVWLGVLLESPCEFQPPHLPLESQFRIRTGPAARCISITPICRTATICPANIKQTEQGDAGVKIVRGIAVVAMVVGDGTCVFPTKNPVASRPRDFCFFGRSARKVTRTPTGCPTGSLVQRVYQFRHPSKWLPRLASWGGDTNEFPAIWQENLV